MTTTVSAERHKAWQEESSAARAQCERGLAAGFLEGVGSPLQGAALAGERSGVGGAQRPASGSLREQAESVAESRVLVVGGGVSGCACAATLAALGVGVTVLSSSLDAVGQPAYGPIVAQGEGGWARFRAALELLPRPLREVWEACCFVPKRVSTGGARVSEGADEASCMDFPSFVCVDGRMLSIETKRALECVPGLRFRQGLAIDLRLQEEMLGEMVCSRAAVETAFGEIVGAETVVLAVGLSLGGWAQVGEAIVPGGRYGEVPSEALKAALERLGVSLRDRRVEVRPRVCGGANVFAAASGRHWAEEESWAVMRSTSGSAAQARWVELCSVGDRLGGGRPRSAEGSVPGREGLEKEERRKAGFAGRVGWPVEYPPAVHWTLGARTEVARALMSTWESEQGDASERRPVLVPDGVATAEVYVAGEARQAGWHEHGESRPGHVVSGQVVVSLTPSGRLLLPHGGAAPVWVTGRAAGAADYVESLVSGVRTGVEVAGALGIPSSSGSPGREGHSAG